MAKRKATALVRALPAAWYGVGATLWLFATRAEGALCS